MGQLYIVPTPIGNLEDITLRALRVLSEVSLIAAEDTRVTGRLLAHFEIDTPQISYHEHNKLSKLDTVLDALREGDVALVSDAGTPGLSDPGYELVRAAIDAGIDVVPLPGASAILTALAASGLATDRFLYAGFLPRKTSARRGTLEAYMDAPVTLIFFESPHRLLDTLADIQAVFGERPLVVAREITKLYEEFWRGTAAGAIRHFEAQPPRGEITIVIEGASEESPTRWEEDEVRDALAAHLEQGMARSAAARTVAADSGWERQEVYKLDV